MSPFARLIRFESAEDGSPFFTDLDQNAPLPSLGEKIAAFKTIDELSSKVGEKTVTIGRVCVPALLFDSGLQLLSGVIRQLLAPLPRDDIPIYCVGLNYHSHAKEASVRPRSSTISSDCVRVMLNLVGRYLDNSSQCQRTRPCGQSQHFLSLTPGRKFPSMTFVRKVFSIMRSVCLLSVTCVLANYRLTMPHRAAGRTSLRHVKAMPGCVAERRKELHPGLYRRQ